MGPSRHPAAGTAFTSSWMTSTRRSPAAVTPARGSATTSSKGRAASKSCSKSPPATSSSSSNPPRERSEHVDGSGQLLDEGGCEPLSVTLGCPASIAHEEAIDLGGHQRVDEVGGVAFPKSGLERAGASKCVCDPALTS